LTPEQLADLRASGLTDATIAAAGLYCERDGDRVRDVLGGWMSVRTARQLGPCLAFPYLDAAGQLMTFTAGDGRDRPFVRLKPAKPRADAKNKGRTIKYEAPAGAPCRAYFPPDSRAALADPAVPLLVTEGEKKALAADQHGLPCVGLGGVWAWVVRRERDEAGKGIGPRELIPDLAAVTWAGRVVTIVYDSDLAAKPDVQWARWCLAEVLREHGADVRVADLPAGPDGAKCGLDDFLVAHGPDPLRALIASATPPARPVSGDPRPEVVVTTDEFEVNAAAIAALAPVGNLYARGGMLVRVVRTGAGPERRTAVRRPADSPVVRPVAPATLRELLTRAARFVQIRGTGEKQEKVPAHPPGWCVAGVHEAGRWPRVKPLEAVVDYPVVLGDGSVLAAPGYDPRSGLLLAVPGHLRLSVPESPTRADIVAAVRVLEDVVADFPFERPAHRAAWVAHLLTPLAWFGFEGPAPLLLIDANVRAAGKGLLADVAALTLTGRRFAVMSYTPDRDELRKRITSLAAEGERLVLLDNLAGPVGNDVLDAALTATWWKDRVLGVNRTYDGPLHAVWFATGNNVQLGADTSRRCSHCRLESALERPELRADVRHRNLRRHVLDHRGELLSAALTLLRGWYAADRPRAGLPAWGSYEGWSDVVREAVVFAGLPDPGETRVELQTAADRDAQAVSALLDALARADPGRQGLTTAGMVEAVRKPADPAPDWVAEMRGAIEELCGRLDGRALGYRLKHFKRRNFGGRMVDEARRGQGGVVRWAVFPVAAGQAAASPPSPPSPPAPGGRDGGEGGDGGDGPAQPDTVEFGP
jgi:hypothetical protein